MIQTKLNEQVKVEFTTDLTKMIKFESGDEAKCKCNVFNVKTGTNKKAQFLWKKGKHNVVNPTTKATPLLHGEEKKRQNGKKEENHDLAFGSTGCHTRAQVAAASAADAATVKTNNTSPAGRIRQESRPISPSPVQDQKRQSGNKWDLPKTENFPS